MGLVGFDIFSAFLPEITEAEICTGFLNEFVLLLG